MKSYQYFNWLLANFDKLSTFGHNQDFVSKKNNNRYTYPWLQWPLATLDFAWIVQVSLSNPKWLLWHCTGLWRRDEWTMDKQPFLSRLGCCSWCCLFSENAWIQNSGRVFSYFSTGTAHFGISALPWLICLFKTPRIKSDVSSATKKINGAFLCAKLCNLRQLQVLKIGLVAFIKNSEWSLSVPSKQAFLLFFVWVLQEICVKYNFWWRVAGFFGKLKWEIC